MDAARHAIGTLPTPTTALGLFEGEWSSALPPAFTGIPKGPGHATLFEDSQDPLDPRANSPASQGGTCWNWVRWKGGHSYMLDRAGARVTAVESNSHAYLKCLVTKELTGSGARFLYGDFMMYLDEARRRGERFDLVIASGVLYHMEKPLELLELLGDVSSRLFLSGSATSSRTNRSGHPTSRCAGRTNGPPEPTVQVSRRLHARAWQQRYLESLEWAGFSGGAGEGSQWLHRQDLLSGLEVLGCSTQSRSTTSRPTTPTGRRSPFLAVKGTA